jgi:hypothetical protein
VDVSLVRFTRRQLREALHSSGAGWGDTQLNVHRTDSGSYGYELTWRPPTPAPTSGDVDGDRRDVDGGRGDVGQGYGRFLVGLTDPATLYDTNRSGPQGAWSGGGRPLVGGRSGPGRPTPESPRDAAEQHEQGEIDAQVDPVPPDALIGLHGLADVRRGA